MYGFSIAPCRIVRIAADRISVFPVPQTFSFLSEFYDSVQRMEQLRRDSEDRIRAHIVSMMGRLYHRA